MTKEQILAELSESRAALARDGAALRAELDFAAKFNQRVRRKPMAWLGGAAALGWLLAGPKTKTRVVTKFVKSPGKRAQCAEKSFAARRGPFALLMAAFRFAAPLVKPALSAYIGKRFTELAQKQAR